MRSIAIVALLILMLVAGVSVALAADVHVTVRDGRVSIVAKNATVAEILAEWARVGQVKVEHVERVPGERVTIEMKDVSEQQALASLLRHSGGYIAIRRTAVDREASDFERILVAPVSVARAPANAAPGDANPAAAATNPMASVQASPVSTSPDQTAAGQAAAGQTNGDQTTANQTSENQAPARDRPATPPAVTDSQQPAVVFANDEPPIVPGTVDDIPPQDPRAQAAFKARQALEVADPRKFNFPKPVAPPKQPGGH